MSSKSPELELGLWVVKWTCCVTSCESLPSLILPFLT